MLRKLNLLRPVYFKEMPCPKPPDDNSPTNKFPCINRIKNGSLVIEHGDHRRYCKILLYHLKKMDEDQTEFFIKASAEQSVYPIAWLNDLERLISINIPLLGGRATPDFLAQLFIFIDDIRRDYECALEHEGGLAIRKANGRYSFKKVRFHLNNIKGYDKQILFLKRCKIEYLQFKPKYVAIDTTPFDQKIDLEIERLTAENEYNAAKSQNNTQSPIQPIQKIKINAQINQFVDIFYQMLNELKIQNLPLIETSNANLAKILSGYFTDSNGASLEQSTIETYLQKNKPEKRPKAYNRITLRI